MRNMGGEENERTLQGGSVEKKEGWRSEVAKQKEMALQGGRIEECKWHSVKAKKRRWQSKAEALRNMEFMDSTVWWPRNRR